MQRWAWTLSANRYNIQFRPTHKRGNADGLSRLPLANEHSSDATDDATVFNITQLEALPVTVSKLPFATARDRVLSKVCRYVKNGWPPEVSDDLRPYRNRKYELTVEEGCVM